jgi:hypothetical protein
MAMSDCDKCWETPCKCGWEYRNDNKQKRMKFAAAILGVSYELLDCYIGDNIPEQHLMSIDKENT